MKFDHSHLELRLAQSQKDLLAAQALRYEVFVKEMGASTGPVEAQEGLERDEFDRFCDHLILIDRRIEDDRRNVVGVYRLLSSTSAQKAGGFYSQNEFDLRPIVDSGRPILELGRSCIRKSHRDGMVLHLLWNGLAQYVIENEIEILFGTASFPGVNYAQFAQSLSLLHYDYLAKSELRVEPNKGINPAAYLVEYDQLDKAGALRAMPSLIKSYLRLGGRIGEGVFVDTVFNTTDVCMILDRRSMTDKQVRQFSKGQI